MAVKKKSRANAVPLIVESHPADYQGYPFITLIQYRKAHVLAIVDNSDDESIKLYVLDLCGPERVREEQVIEVAAHWYENSRTKYPLSIEFSKRGMTTETGRIYRTFNTEFVTRVIGPLPKFEMVEVTRVKRRKRKPLPPNVEIHKKSAKVVELRK
jgi:hypothetical protein